MQLEKGVSKKQFLKKWLRVEFDQDKFQETTPTHLDQHTKGQTLIQKDKVQQRHLKALQSSYYTRKNDMHKRTF